MLFWAHIPPLETPTESHKRKVGGQKHVGEAKVIFIRTLRFALGTKLAFWESCFKCGIVFGNA